MVRTVRFWWRFWWRFERRPTFKSYHITNIEIQSPTSINRHQLQVTNISGVPLVRFGVGLVGLTFRRKISAIYVAYFTPTIWPWYPGLMKSLLFIATPHIPIGFSKFLSKNVSNLHFGCNSIKFTDFDQFESFSSGRQLSRYILFDFKFSDVEHFTTSFAENAPTETLMVFEQANQ